MHLHLSRFDECVGCAPLIGCRLSLPDAEMPVQDSGEDGVHRRVVKVVDGDGVEMAHEACCYRVPAST